MIGFVGKSNNVFVKLYLEYYYSAIGISLLLNYYNALVATNSCFVT
jgi:hypothetical protein